MNILTNKIESMENKNKMTEEDKNRKAYYALKEIQRKYGFDNIAKLREFHKEVSKLFFDYDREENIFKWEDFELTFREIFKFFSDMDTMDESEINKAYSGLTGLLNEEKVTPQILGFIHEAYTSRLSEPEKLRRRIIKEGLDIEKTLRDYYKDEIEKKYRKVFKRAIDFAFEFPNEYSDWTNQKLNKEIYMYKRQFEDIANTMRGANVPNDIIQDFLRHAVVIPDYRKRIQESWEKQRAERQSRMN